MALWPNGVMGVVDGLPPAGLETETYEADRQALLRHIGYRLRGGLNNVGLSHEDPSFPADATRDVRLLSLGRPAVMVSERAQRDTRAVRVARRRQ